MFKPVVLKQRQLTAAQPKVDALESSRMSTAEELASRLRAAAVAYYETDTPLMTDDDYDATVEQLRKVAPQHPFFTEVGATVREGAVKLPMPMASLDKKKPESVPSVLKGKYMMMDKLDGISALWCYGYTRKPALYLRGNGTEGQDVSHCISGITGLVQSASPMAIVRGELILPRDCGEKAPRNWVNGILHQKNPSKDDLSRVRFVAYQVCMPSNMTRSQQMTWLSNAGFETAWSQSVTDLTAEQLKEAFKTRRAESKYECDGIVVGTDTVPLAPGTSNPKDAFAFKMPVADQMATTVVREVDWASSRTGNWIPRLRFDPVQIGAATIEYCTGFHAQFIRNNRLGPGARVVIRRSGDVIPTLDSVLEPAVTWFEPPAGRWKWDETETHAVDTTAEATPEKLALEMAHSLVALGIEGYSKTSTKKLVDGGIRELKDLKKATKPRLQQLLGNVNGEKLYDAFQELKATEQQWVRAWCGWPKGFGESRISATFAVEADVTKWPTLVKAPAGQSMTAFVEIQKAVPAYIKWRDAIGVKVARIDPVVTVAVAVAHKGNYVMSGFRDADLQKRLADAGWKEQDGVKKDTTLLLVPDDAKETGKVKAAKAAGIRILPRSQVNTLF